MVKKNRVVYDSSSDNRDSDDESDKDSDDPKSPVKTPKEEKTTPKESKPIVNKTDTDSETSESDDDWTADGNRKGKKKKKKKPQKAVTPKRQPSESSNNDSDSQQSSGPEEGEVTDSDSGSDSGSEVSMDDEFNDGYDDEMMGDEEDRARLMQMTEKEREQEIYNRVEKREVLRTRFEIEKKLRLAKKKEQKLKVKKQEMKQKNEVSASARSKERRRMVEEKKDKLDKKAQAIKDLKEQREKKRKLAELQQQKSDPDGDQKADDDSDSDSEKPVKKLKASDIYSDDDDDDDASGNERDDQSEASYHSRSEDEDEAPRKADYISSKEQLSRIRLSRFKMEKWVHAPFFSKTAIGCFVRVSIGGDDGRHIYRIAEILDVVETAKVYQLGPSRTNKGFRVRHGGQERVFRLEFISNQDFTDTEFFKWKESLDVDNIPLPTVDDVDRKCKDIQLAMNYQYKEDDVETIVKEKERFKKNPCNYAMRKTQLLKNKEMAEINGDVVEAKKLNEELKRIEERAKELDEMRTHTIRAISYINVRNRQRNILEAEKAIKEETEKNKLNASYGDDPFTRRKCMPILVTKARDPNMNADFLAHIAKQKEQELQKQKEEAEVTKPPEQKDSETKNTSTPAFTPKNLPKEDLFSAHDFEIKIDLHVPPTRLSANAHHLSNSVAQNTPRRSLNLEEYKKMRGLI